MLKLFIKFNKLEEHEDINKQGTGIGLSICKNLVEQMGGKIKVQSDVGVGTSFQIIVPTYSQNHSIKRFINNNSCFKTTPKMESVRNVNYSQFK